MLLLDAAVSTSARRLIIRACLLFMAAALHAEGPRVGASRPIAIELESQIPCFFFGGYQLSAGIRYERLRLRAGVQDSGRADFESTGLDSRNSGFTRSYDLGSFSFSADCFLTKYLFATACLGSNRWRVQSRDTEAADELRTFDVGLGLGLQYVLFNGPFVQIAAQVNFRERQSRVIQGRTYTVPGIDYSPALRLGYRF